MDDGEVMDLSLFDTALLEECWGDAAVAVAAASTGNESGNNAASSDAKASETVPSFERQPSNAASTETSQDATQQYQMTNIAPGGAIENPTNLSQPTTVAMTMGQQPNLQDQTTTIGGVNATPSASVPLQALGTTFLPSAVAVATTTQANAPQPAPVLPPMISNINLLPLALNAIAAGVNLTQLLPSSQNPPTPIIPTSSIDVTPVETVSTSVPTETVFTSNTVQLPTNNNNTTRKGRKEKTKRGSTTRTSSKASETGAKDRTPPFLLFDAPIELRHNFMESQRKAGLPVLKDNNSYHFRQHSHQAMPRLVDARHGDYSKRLKNAKEQKRAQKITDLIDQLRNKIEEDGWHVGVKSKLHTLSSCANYIKHLAKTNKEKEEAVAKARADLEHTRAKMEAEKANQASSDPESTTSTLTSCSKQSSPEDIVDSSIKISKRALDATKDNISPKKRRRADQVPQKSSSESGASVSVVKPNPGTGVGNCVAFDKAGESVSDMTASVEKDSMHPASRSSSPSSSSEEKSERQRSSCFELDYEEVFLKSNIPQILAATSGRMISWNDFFLTATGLSKEDVKQLTIFSLVHGEQLADLFEIVAASLKASPKPVSVSEDDQDQTNESGKGSERKELNDARDFKAITLPCTNFSAEFDKTGKKVPPLFMTVTLMADEDPRKRCFHCVFTDSPVSANGILAPISPELLAHFCAAHPVKKRVAIIKENET